MRGGGVPGATGYTLGASGGAAPGRRSLHLPGLVPPAGSERRGGSRTCGPGAQWPPASRGLPRAACRNPWSRRASPILTRSKVQIPNASPDRFGFGGNPPHPAQLSSSSKRPAAARKIQVGSKRTISFAKKEKIQATLIHPGKEKFPCRDETGDAGRHHPRRRPDRTPEVGDQMFVPS